MGIAIITGASSGMGREFAKQLEQAGGINGFWLIARRQERLTALAEELTLPVKTISEDLSDPEFPTRFSALLSAEQPRIGVLVNAGGYGKFGTAEEIPLSESFGMIDLNCRALTAMTALCRPYFQKGTEVYQFASLAAFQPVPYLAVYAATKAYVLSYTRAIAAELRPQGIKVMAVCPGWVQTEFFDRAKTVNASAIKHFYHIYQAENVVKQAIRDMKRGRSVSIHGFRTRSLIRLQKLVPHRLAMRVWMNQQK